jgi:hypothetical protein
MHRASFAALLGSSPKIGGFGLPISVDADNDGWLTERIACLDAGAQRSRPRLP